MNQKLKDYVSGGIAVTVAKGLSLGSSLAVLWLLNRILEKEVFGSYAAAMALIQLAAVFGLAGLDQTILYRLSRQKAEPGVLSGGGVVRSVFMITLPIGLLVTGIIVTAELFDLWEMSQQGKKYSFWLAGLAIAIPLMNAQKVYASWYQARHRVSESVLVPASINLSRALILGFMLIIWPTPAAVLLGIIVSHLVPIFIWTMKTPFNNFMEEGKLTGSDLVYGAKLALASLANRGARNIDILMLGLLSTVSFVAEYAVAIQLVALTRAGDVLLKPVFTPRLGRHLAHERKSSARVEYSQTRLLALVTALGLGAVFVVGGEYVLGLFGNYEAAYPILMIAAATAVVSIGFGANGQYLNMAGHASWTLFIVLLLLAINVILNLVLIPALGGSGAALSSLISVTVMNSFSAILIWRLDRMATVSVGVVFSMVSGSLTLLGVAFMDFSSVVAGPLLILTIAVLLMSEKDAWYSLANRLWNEKKRN